MFGMSVDLLLAQSTQKSTSESVNQAQNLLSEITTGKVTQALIVVAIAYTGIFAVEKLVNWLSERVQREWRLTIKQSLPFWRTAVLTVVALILLNLFVNLSANNILALTGTVAVALGFAFKDYATSVIAGFIGIFEAPYRVGDRVKIGESYGEIVSYGLRSVRLRTPSDNIVSIPHSKIWTEAISNANSGDLEAQVVTKFYLSHSVDVQFVNAILYRVAYTSKYTQLKLPIVVIVEEKPWGTLFKLKCYPMDARDEFIYQTDLIKRAKRSFARHQITYAKVFSGDIAST